MKRRKFVGASRHRDNEARAIRAPVLPRFRGIAGFAFAVILLLAGGESSATAWDSPGHEIVATIAYARLNPKARQAVTDLARQVPTDTAPYDAITAACWMDDLRRKDPAMPDHGLFYSWHYIDLGIEPGDPVPSFEPGDDNDFHGNVVQALKRADVVLRGGTDAYIKTKTIALAMVMHLVGDIHQPLHAATHYFRGPGGWLRHDAGGNRELVVNGPGNDRGFNLHAFWDSAWRASFDENTGRVVIDERYHEHGGHDPAAVQALAEALSRQTPSPGVNLQPDFDQWARESNQLAQSFVYRDITATESRKYCRLSRSYIGQANLLARQRLVLAGYRLAVLLNETLGADVPPAIPKSYPARPSSGDDELGPRFDSLPP